METAGYYYNSYLSTYGRGGGPIHQKYFVCGGAEQDLSQCNSYNITTPQSHDYDVGIGCSGMYMIIIIISCNVTTEQWNQISEPYIQLISHCVNGCSLYTVVLNGLCINCR